ncbi:AMP-dependent synthetase [Clostridium sp. AF12-19]|nr:MULTISPECIES: amino acid adenylation domain-containing protein [unclassified Clostridium]RHS25683.1 AMP-dependent synthetase [Clostridium sp. AF12-28]RHS29904.1 AMP-dependent synthetase [Clostridium sp. AF12-19]
MIQTNILEYLEKTVKEVPDKTAYTDGKHGLTFAEVFRYSRAIGSYLSREGFYREPVVIYMKKSPEAVAAFYGAVYGRCFYVPFDEEMPEYRVSLILETLKPRLMICDAYTEKKLIKIGFSGRTLRFEDAVKTEIRDEKLAEIREASMDTDPIYIVFTSGSTGVPKGVAACHRSVLDYVENLSKVLGFNRETVFGNQSPLYFDACLKELYPTMMFGAITYLVPKSLFMFPVKLVEYLNENHINTVCWVVSALTMISSMGTFDKVVPKYLHTVAFGSEVFPIKQFNLWRHALPEAQFTNLYGPTECTGMSCYYRVNREFGPDDVIPIGRPFKNTEILLLNDEDQPAGEGETGEICIRGTCVTLGYYRNPEKTKEVFVQNPLNDCYPELIYRTGDIGRYNEFGELVFVSRKDHQIKHMGHRIELGEIEVHVNQMAGIRMSCCVYDKEREKIVLFYVGDAEGKDIIKALKEKLPRYMIPNLVEKIEEMPFTANGKLNRMELKNRCANL